MHIQSKLHPVVVAALADLGLLTRYNVVLPLYAINGFALSLLGRGEEDVRWQVFCDVWPVIAVLEQSRIDCLDAEGLDPMVLTRELMDAYDRSQADHVSERN